MVSAARRPVLPATLVFVPWPLPANSSTGRDFAKAFAADQDRRWKTRFSLTSFDHGVSLFFVLSGFILAHVYPRLDSGAETKRFLILRVARIWPAHAATLLLAVVALSLPVINWQFLTNLAIVQGWIPSEPWYYSFNAPSWSISIEFSFYLAFPLLMALAYLLVPRWRILIRRYSHDMAIDSNGPVYVRGWLLGN